MIQYKSSYSSTYGLFLTISAHCCLLPSGWYWNFVAYSLSGNTAFLLASKITILFLLFFLSHGFFAAVLHWTAVIEICLLTQPLLWSSNHWLRFDVNTGSSFQWNWRSDLDCLTFHILFYFFKIKKTIKKENSFHASQWANLLNVSVCISAHQQFQWYHKRVKGGAAPHHIFVLWLAECIIVLWWLALSFIWLQLHCDITVISSPSSVLLIGAVWTTRSRSLSTESILQVSKQFFCSLGVSRGWELFVHLKTWRGGLSG